MTKDLGPWVFTAKKSRIVKKDANPDLGSPAEDTMKTLLIPAMVNKVVDFSGYSKDLIKHEVFKEDEQTKVKLWVEMPKPRDDLKDQMESLKIKQYVAPSSTEPESTDKSFSQMSISQLRDEMTRIPEEYRVKSIRTQDLVDALEKCQDDLRQTVDN